MLIWANKNEVNVELINSIEELCDKAPSGFRSCTKGWVEGVKAWELSVIFRQIQRHFGKRKDISILDFGAGSSPFGAYLNRIGYQFVTLLDLEKGWLPNVNQENYNKMHDACIKYVKTDVTQNYDGEHDVIFSASTLEHIPDKGLRALQALSRCLKSGGLFIHVVDYPYGVHFKKLIDNCGVSISYRSEDTPGCEEFKHPPEYTWWCDHRGKLITRIAFFNSEGE